MARLTINDTPATAKEWEALRDLCNRSLGGSAVEDLFRDNNVSREDIKHMFDRDSDGNITCNDVKGFKPEVFSDIDSILKKHGYFLPEKCKYDPWADKEIVLELLAIPKAMENADDWKRRNNEIARILVAGLAPEDADKWLGKNDTIIRTITSYPYWILMKYADKSLRNDKEVIIAAVKQDGRALQFAHESLRKDKEVVLDAVKNNGMALEYAESFKNDRDVVLAAVKQNGLALQFAHESLRDDKGFALAAVKNNGMALEYVWGFQNDKEVVLEAVKNNGMALEYAEPFNNDRYVVLAAVKQNGLALQFAHESLRDDKEFILVAVKNGDLGLLFYEVDDPSSLNIPNEIVLFVVDHRNGNVLWKIFDESIYMDKELIIAAIENKKSDSDSHELAEKLLRKLNGH